jgi:hypothetical protein
MQHEIRVSRVVLDDIINHKKRFVRKGKLRFNAISITSTRVELVCDGEVVAGVDHGPLENNEEFTLAIFDGWMRLGLEEV